jgi:hypothetical protein
MVCDCRAAPHRDLQASLVGRQRRQSFWAVTLLKLFIENFPFDFFPSSI